MPYYGDALPYYYGGPFSNHSSLMTGTGRTLHSPLGSSRYAPHLTTISESPLSALRRYTPAATMTVRPKRVIDTADIDVSTPRALSNTGNNDNQRSRLRRDRPTIRIRSQALKDNPALREHYERHEKTVGELLVEKFLIKDKKAEAEGELRTKLYSQISLGSELTNKQRDELQEAIQRRVTRRMTRRRSSADIQMDQEQIEREVLFAQAQADALDSLVAQEQAEIEVETRMGTLIRKNLVRSVGPLARSKNDIRGLSGDEDDDTRTKKLAKKVKKRKKTTDKPSPPGGSELDTKDDETRTKKALRESNTETIEKSTKVDNNMSVNGDDDETTEPQIEEDNNENTNETPLTPTKALKFKIEASNSVGDFSTLWINASVAEEQEKQRKISEDTVEQFRDSVRLPAPKHSLGRIVKPGKKDMMIEEHQQIVVLPVKKRYVKDDTRNSVYLTLKTQKNVNVNKIVDADETTDRIEGVVNKVDESLSLSAPMTNGKSIDEETPTKSLTANTTTEITRQPRANKVAKFRSKDITESDVEVKSISELPGTGETRGKTGTKDVSSEKLSALNEGRSNVLADESISVSLNRDAIIESIPANSEDHSRNKISAKVSTAPSDEVTSLEVTKIRDTENTLKIDNYKSIKALTAKDDGIIANDGVTKSTGDKNGVVEKIGKPLKRAKKETKDLQKINKNSIGDESKRLKRSGTSSLDFLSTRVDVENLKEAKINEKEQPSDGTGSSAASISSVVTPCSNVVESLPNASTINIPTGENRLNDAVKIHNEGSNVTGIESEETGISENFVANEDLSLSRKITGKFVETRGKISKPIGVTSDDSEVEGLSDSRKVRDKYQNVVEQPATIESPKILTSTRKDVNFSKFENDDVVSDKLTKNKTVLSIDAARNDDDNVVELPKLRKNRKIVPLSSRNNSTEIVELTPDSPGLEVRSDGRKKYQTRTRKPLVVATSGDEITASKVKKIPKDSVKNKTEIVIEANISKDSSEKGIESVPPILETARLTNGALDKKSRLIVAIKELPKPEVHVKSTEKAVVPVVKKDEEIDFWGEIESQRIAKPSTKISEKIVPAKEILSDNCVADAEQNNDISELIVIVLEPEVKSNTSPETGTPDETRTLVGGEKKLNKVKKKKTSESSGCKKKDQEKASSETIFEHFTSPDGVDEEKSHQQPEQLEQQSEKLSEKSSSRREPGEEEICESLEIDRFERNLSTIAEELLSPVTEEVTRNIEALDLVVSCLRKEEESVTTKLDTSRDSPLLGGDSESRDKTATEDLSPSVGTSHGEPEVIATIEPEACKERIESGVLTELEKQPCDDTSLPSFEAPLPVITIIEAPITQPEEEILPEVTAEEEAPEDEADEGPGTPTNETVDETILATTTNNISKWYGRTDLSLDEPDKDIGPEVAPSEKKKKESTKKKVSCSKKISKKSSVGSNSTKSTGVSSDSSKKNKLGRRKKSSTKNVKDSDNRIDERSESKISNSSDTTLKPGGPNARYSPKNSGRNSPKQRPLDLIKMFYTTPASLLTATPRDLSKVRRAKIKKRKHSSRTASASSDSTGSTRSTQSTGTAESTGSTEHEDDTEQKRISSTRSNDSGFDGSPRLSSTDFISLTHGN